MEQKILTKNNSLWRSIFELFHLWIVYFRLIYTLQNDINLVYTLYKYDATWVDSWTNLPICCAQQNILHTYCLWMDVIICTIFDSTHTATICLSLWGDRACILYHLTSNCADWICHICNKSGSRTHCVVSIIYKVFLYIESFCFSTCCYCCCCRRLICFFRSHSILSETNKNFVEDNTADARRN